jgi:hypothetical protein
LVIGFLDLVKRSLDSWFLVVGGEMERRKKKQGIRAAFWPSNL